MMSGLDSISFFILRRQRNIHYFSTLPVFLFQPIMIIIFY